MCPQSEHHALNLVFPTIIHRNKCFTKHILCSSRVRSTLHLNSSGSLLEFEPSKNVLFPRNFFTINLIFFTICHIFFCSFVSLYSFLFIVLANLFSLSCLSIFLFTKSFLYGCSCGSFPSSLRYFSLFLSHWTYGIRELQI